MVYIEIIGYLVSSSKLKALGKIESDPALMIFQFLGPNPTFMTGNFKSGISTGFYRTNIDDSQLGSPILGQVGPL